MVEAIPGLKVLLDYLASERRGRTQKKDEALTAIYAASGETKLYLEELNHKKRRNRRREQELARLWMRAAVPIRHFDRDFAMRCLIKSEFWISPHRWTKRDIQERRIGISEVFERARQLLLE